MALSMKTLLSADATLPDSLRSAIVNDDRESATQLMNLGLSACEAAELLDRPCDKRGDPARAAG
jgi:hypothetical protein